VFRIANLRADNSTGPIAASAEQPARRSPPAGQPPELQPWPDACAASGSDRQCSVRSSFRDQQRNDRDGRRPHPGRPRPSPRAQRLASNTTSRSNTREALLSLLINAVRGWQIPPDVFSQPARPVPWPCGVYRLASERGGARRDRD
jgi:hypothetical protein